MSLTRKAADAAAIAAFGLGLCLASVDAKADGTNVRVTAPPEINWSGWYVGAHAGWGHWNADRGYPVDEHYVQAGTFLSQSTNGWFTGGQVGFNHQFSRIVVGGELSLSNANIDTSATVQGYPSRPASQVDDEAEQSRDRHRPGRRHAWPVPLLRQGRRCRWRDYREVLGSGPSLVGDDPLDRRLGARYRLRALPAPQHHLGHRIRLRGPRGQDVQRAGQLLVVGACFAGLPKHSHRVRISVS